MQLVNAFEQLTITFIQLTNTVKQLTIIFIQSVDIIKQLTITFIQLTNIIEQLTPYAIQLTTTMTRQRPTFYLRFTSTLGRGETPTTPAQRACTLVLNFNIINHSSRQTTARHIERRRHNA